VFVGASFVRFYLLYWIVDHVIGVGLSLLGFLAPAVYVRWTLSPLSAVESYGFLIATVAFAAYVWRVRPGRRLYLFLVLYVLADIVMTVTFQISLMRTATSGATITESSYLEAMQTPLYVSAALSCSLAGIALWLWIAHDRHTPERLETPSKLRNLRERRLSAMESRR